jgi:single-stranded-DNA-specific exonuclease
VTFIKNIVRRASSVTVAGVEGLNPVIARVLANRDIDSLDQLGFSNRDLLPPTAMNNIETAARLIHDHLCAGSRITILGDYDVDGATSCTLSILALKAMGARNVGYLVPDRFKLGYGLSAALVDLAAAEKSKLMITVDNGISALDGARRARELGIALVITDHHLPGEKLPDADAIVNPNLQDDAFPSKNLAGVGVVFYVLSMVRRLLEQSGWFARNRIEPVNLANYLDLVALGTYADLVRLDANNRILVAQGLKRINAGRCRPGILALAEIAGRRPGALVAADLGFQIAPRLNAAGRLQDISVGIECLLEDDAGRARVLAERLDSINRERKELEQQMQQQAVNVLDADSLRGDASELGLCVYRRDWHQGIVGLVASRLKERRSLPAIAFAPGEGNELKGSARSVPGVHIRDVLCEIDADAPGVLLRYGGHAMAAGMTIRVEDFADFRRHFLEKLARHADEINAANQIFTDGPLVNEFDDLAFIRQLRTLAPWGQGFPEPMFDNTFRVLHQQLVGEVHLKLVLQPERDNRRVEAIRFRYLEHPGAPCPELDRIHAAYRLDINEFAGRIRPQLILEYFHSLQ